MVRPSAVKFASRGMPSAEEVDQFYPGSDSPRKNFSGPLTSNFWAISRPARSSPSELGQKTSRCKDAPNAPPPQVESFTYLIASDLTRRNWRRIPTNVAPVSMQSTESDQEAVDSRDFTRQRLHSSTQQYKTTERAGHIQCSTQYDDASDVTARRVLQFEGGSRYRPYIS
jgi:hypothetical protein